jgi:hypothetical protein
VHTRAPLRNAAYFLNMQKCVHYRTGNESMPFMKPWVGARLGKIERRVQVVGSVHPNHHGINETPSGKGQDNAIRETGEESIRVTVWRYTAGRL